MLDERIEIAVAEQKVVPIEDAARRDERIDRLADLDAAKAKRPGVSSGLDRGVTVDDLDDVQ